MEGLKIKEINETTADKRESEPEQLHPSAYNIDRFMQAMGLTPEKLKAIGEEVRAVYVPDMEKQG